jgi:hypothetical protein
MSTIDSLLHDKVSKVQEWKHKKDEPVDEGPVTATDGGGEQGCCTPPGGDPGPDR